MREPRYELVYAKLVELLQLTLFICRPFQKKVHNDCDKQLFVRTSIPMLKERNEAATEFSIQKYLTLTCRQQTKLNHWHGNPFIILFFPVEQLLMYAGSEINHSLFRVSSLLSFFSPDIFSNMLESRYNFLCALLLGLGQLSLFTGKDILTFIKHFFLKIAGYDTQLTIVEPILHSVNERSPDTIDAHAGYYGYISLIDTLHVLNSEDEK